MIALRLLFLNTGIRNYGLPSGCCVSRLLCFSLFFISSIFQSPCDSFFDSGCSGECSSHAASIRGTVGKTVMLRGQRSQFCVHMHQHVRTSMVETSMCLADVLSEAQESLGGAVTSPQVTASWCLLASLWEMYSVP